MSNNATIGIDLGTSGCRAIAINKQGQILASCQQAFEASVLRNTQHNPQHHWQIVKSVLANLFLQCRTLTIEAITVDATSGSVLISSDLGEPLTPIIMYNDGRAIVQSKLIKSIAPPYSGAHGATSGLAKLLYLNQQHHFDSDTVLMHQADWINFNLGAPLGLTDENNALKSGYDPVIRRWPDWMSSLNLTSKLPDVVAAGTIIGELSNDLADEFDLSNQPKILAGTTDSIAAFIATGSDQIGNAVTSLGSTLVVKLISDSPLFIPEQGVYSHRLGDKWLVGGASNTGGAVLAKYFSSIQLQQLSEQIDVTKQPMFDYYPLVIKGERFPVNNPELQAIVSPRPKNDVDFLHALLCGMAKIEQQAYQCLEQAGASPLTSITTVGGGSVNQTWQAIRQRYIKVPFLTTPHIDAAYGSAQIAQGCLTTNKD